jgi:hypothetical protein
MSQPYFGTRFRSLQEIFGTVEKVTKIIQERSVE